MKKIAPAKINVYLKLVKKRGFYHELNSRFIRYENLFDEVVFEDKTSDEEFELVGEFGCKKSENSITKAYYGLKEAGFSGELEEFFKSKRVHVKKRIPEFSGLGGGSSDCASFLLLCNEVMNLQISKERLCFIGANIGADVPFFLQGVQSANVKGVGEIVEEFEDDIPNVKLIFPKVKCSTMEVFEAFDAQFKPFNSSWQNCSSKMLLNSFNNTQLNDLLNPALRVYPDLSEYAKQGYFMSGSGSTMFEVKNG